ncbi:unnamed protein product [Malus baccata var. baccata]
MITVQLKEDNFVKWDYQFQSMLKGYDYFDFFSGESQCLPKFVINTETGVIKEITIAYKDWVKTDVSILSLLVAKLSDEAMDYVIGCKTSREAWKSLQERYASVSVVRVNQLKTEFHIVHKGADSVDKYLLRLKVIKDQLIVAGERITENDVVIAALSGLPPKFEMIKTVILARDTPISMKDFRAQLIGVEGNIESRLITLSSSMAAMYVQGNGSNTQGSQGNTPSYEQWESSNAQRSQGRNNYNCGNNNRRFNGNNFNNRKFSSGYNGGNNNYRSYSTFRNNGKGVQNGGSQSYFSSNGSKQGNTWNGDTNYKNVIFPECQICSRKGHTAPNCYFRVDNNQSSRGILVCQICGKRGHRALECFHRNNFSYQDSAPHTSLVGMADQGSNVATEDSNIHGFSAADTWVVNTGATHHMTSRVEVLNHITPYNGDATITVGNGEGLVVKNIGSSVLNTKPKSLILQNVLHVPHITMNLLSVKKLCRDNN